MNNAQKLGELFARFGESVPVMERKKVWFFSITWARNWLSIEDQGDHWAVLLMNGRAAHQPLWGPAFGADFRKDTGGRMVRAGLTGVWQTALSLWPVRDEAQAVKVFAEIAAEIDAAYRYHCGATS